MNNQSKIRSNIFNNKTFSPIPGFKGIAVAIILASLTLGYTSYYTIKNSNILSNIQAKKSIKSETNNLTSSNSKVAALGYIQTRQDPINLSAPAFMEGARVEELLVNRRDKVTAGQIIAVLDNRDRLQAALHQAQRQVQVAQARLAQVQAGAKKGEIQAQKARFQTNQAELQGQIDTQRATIANLKAQLEGESNAQKAEIQRLKAEVANATRECERYSKLEAGGAVSTSQKDNTCLQQATSQEQLIQAEANLTRITTTFQEQIQEAQANLKRTINTLEKQIAEAKSSLEAVAEVREVDVKVAQSELETAQAEVERAQAELNQAYVRSPIDGQVLKINTWAGEIVNNSEGIATIGDTSSMFVTAEVYETDINKVKLGQTATITSGGITQNLTGTVAEIGLEIGSKNVLGTDPVADADARVVEVKIRLDPEDSKLVTNLTNLQVNAIIDTSDF